MAESEKAFDVVRAKRFILEDDKGRTLAEITQHHGDPSIILYNREGSTVMNLEVDHDNDGNYTGGSITRYHNNSSRIEITVDEDGKPNIAQAIV